MKRRCQLFLIVAETSLFVCTVQNFSFSASLPWTSEISAKQLIHINLTIHHVNKVYSSRDNSNWIKLLLQLFKKTIVFHCLNSNELKIKFSNKFFSYLWWHIKPISNIISHGNAKNAESSYFTERKLRCQKLTLYLKEI